MSIHLLQGATLTLVFSGQAAYLWPDSPLTLQDLELAEVVVASQPAHWTIRVLKCFPKENRIFCEVLTYQSGPPAQLMQTPNLQQLLSAIRKISFKSIDTIGLLQTLQQQTVLKTSFEAPELLPLAEAAPVLPPAIPKAPRQKMLRDNFSVRIQDLRFRLGGVSFDHKFKGHPESIELTITNDFIREEFDAIKNYFANILGSKRIQVTATVGLTGDDITYMDVLSPDINRINPQLLDQVKFAFVQQIPKKKFRVEVNKELFTLDEYIDNFEGYPHGIKALYDDEKALFDDLVAVTNTKHYKHLRYLSSRHAYRIMKIRFVHKPFSFVFLLEGQRQYHIVWETLDTEEATYIWHVEKHLPALKLTLQKIEDVLSVMRTQGKTAYLNAREENLQRIYHDYSTLVDGFARWRAELEAYLY